MTPRIGHGRGSFIGLRKDQLGARLLMMLNCIRLAEDYDADFRINWFPRGAAAPKLDTPSDLFDQAFINRHFIDNAEFEKLDSITKPIWTFLTDETPDRLKTHLTDGGHVLLDEGFEIVAFPWEDVDDLQKRFRGFISRIGFNPAVQDHIKQIDAVMSAGGGRVIAYHIRRGDILNEDPWKHKEWPAKIEPDELYSAYLEKNADAGALVFSDQPESIARFTAAHPQVRSITDLVDLDQTKPVQRDFLELFAMSRASQIIAPPISAFSRAAARLSGQERKCFHEVMTLEERDVAYNTVTDRFGKGVSQFITPSEAAHIFVKVARRLQETDRDAEAWEIGQNILDAGADNAFLPLLQAANGIYLSKWDEALRLVDIAIDDPNQWQENYISALAIRAHILGALGKPSQAQQSFLRAFWQKPMLPDVAVVGSFMIRRQRLRPGAVLPFDRDTAMILPIRYQLHNIVLQQNKILKRRALDLSTIAIEWPWFAQDGKTRRLLETKHDLKALRDRLKAHQSYAPGAGPFSFCAMLEARMGRLGIALARNTEALENAPDDPLVRKRQAEILMLRGDHDASLGQMKICMSNAPDHAFWHFLTGVIHEQAGQATAARTMFEQAAAMDDSTAELHAHLADLCRKTGDHAAATAALERAAEIAPNQQRYRNQRDRIMRRSV
ncbi:tetratricopeptide repeat protein [Aliiroseovarius sp. YM-037]|uniref:tetratricopeptide repeat protein n=1 Tax=Aliiroseovarius sp. YM-037 TaxID=3341728 RepID=UPI003A806E3B